MSIDCVSRKRELCRTRQGLSPGPLARGKVGLAIGLGLFWLEFARPAQPAPFRRAVFYSCLFVVASGPRSSVPTLRLFGYLPPLEAGWVTRVFLVALGLPSAGLPSVRVRHPETPDGTFCSAAPQANRRGRSEPLVER